MIQYPMIAWFAAFAVAGASNEPPNLPQKTVATVFTLKAGTAREQAVDLKNQYASAEKWTKSILNATRISCDVPVMLLASTFEGYRQSWVEPGLESVLEAAKADPHDAEIARALIFFVSRTAPLVDPNAPYQRAQQILMEHHCNHPAIGEFAVQLGSNWHDNQGIAFLRKIHQTHPNEAVRKTARTSLANVYKTRAGWAKWHKEFGNLNAENIAFSTCTTFIAAFKELDQIDPESLLAESKKYQ